MWMRGFGFSSSTLDLQISTLLRQGDHELQDRELLKAMQRFESAFGFAQKSGDPEMLALCYGRLGYTLTQMREFDEAKKKLEKGLEHAEITGNDKLVATAKGNLAAVYFAEQDFETALSMYRTVQSMGEEVVGEEAAETIDAVIDVAEILMNMDQLEEAEKLVEEAIFRIERSVQGMENEEGTEMVVLRKNALEKMFEILARNADVEMARLENAVQKYQRICADYYGEKSEGYLGCLNKIWTAYQMRKDTKRSIPFLESLVETAKEIRGTKVDSVFRMCENLALSYLYVGKNAEAEKILMENLKQIEQKHGNGSRQSKTTIFYLSKAYMNSQQWSKCEMVLKRLMFLCKPEEEMLFVADVNQSLAIVAMETKRPNEADHYLKRALSFCKENQEKLGNDGLKLQKEIEDKISKNKKAMKQKKTTSEKH